MLACRQLLVVLLGISALTSALPLRAQIIQVGAGALTGLVGRDAARLSVFAVHEGRLEPVPHQWMEYSREGFPYFPADDSTTPAGSTELIDASDRLLLRKQDGGQRLSGRPTEKVIGEMKVSLPDGSRYFYLVENAYRQATQRYVKFDVQKMVVKSTDYALFMQSNNILVWNDFFYRGYQGSSGQRESILDTLKIRLSAGIFRQNSRITLTNDNLEPRIEEIIEGPLAWQVYATTTLSVAKIPVMKIRNYFLLMPQQTDIHARFTLPLVARTVLQAPEVSVSLDGNQLYGGKLVTSWTGERVAITDGRMSDTEMAMLGTPMQGGNWLWFTTGRGFDLLAFLDFREGFDQPARLLYQDDATLANPPERFPGQLPNVGFTIEQIPIGKEFNFLTRLFFSADSEGLGPGAYAATMLAEPEVVYTPAG